LSASGKQRLVDCKKWEESNLVASATSTNSKMLVVASTAWYRYPVLTDRGHHILFQNTRILAMRSRQKEFIIRKAIGD